MRKFIVISIVLLMLAGFAITSSAQDLVVGRQHIPVGELTVEVIGDDLVVTYTITHPDPEWELLETHLYVRDSAPTKSAPGRFPYGPESPEYAVIDDDVVYTIDLADFAGVPILYIAAQAEVGKIDPVTGDPVLDPITGLQIEETAWAEGDGCIPPCKNWAMYFTFTLTLED